MSFVFSRVRCDHAQYHVQITRRELNYGWSCGFPLFKGRVFNATVRTRPIVLRDDSQLDRVSKKKKKMLTSAFSAQYRRNDDVAHGARPVCARRRFGRSTNTELRVILNDHSSKSFRQNVFVSRRPFSRTCYGSETNSVQIRHRRARTATTARKVRVRSSHSLGLKTDLEYSSPFIRIVTDFDYKTSQNNVLSRRPQVVVVLVYIFMYRVANQDNIPITI